MNHYLIAVLLGLFMGMLNNSFVKAGVLERWQWRPSLLLPRDRRDGLILLISLAVSLYGISVYREVYYYYVGFMLLTNMLFAIAVIDHQTMMVPDQILVFYIMLILLYQCVDFHLLVLISRLSGAVLGAVVLGLSYLFRKDAVGLGDIKLIAVCGLLTGVSGIMELLLKGMVIAGIFSLILLLRKKAKLKSEIPFVPFLWLGSLI